MPSAVNEPRVVDASVIVKVLVQEALSDRAVALFESDAIKIVPAHAAAEVCEVMLRKWRKGEVDGADVRRLPVLLRDRFDVVSLEELLPEALEIAAEASITFYDSLYVAAAVRRRCRLVTCDHAMLARLAPTRYAPFALAL